MLHGYVGPWRLLIVIHVLTFVLLLESNSTVLNQLASQRYSCTVVHVLLSYMYKHLKLHVPVLNLLPVHDLNTWKYIFNEHIATSHRFSTCKKSIHSINSADSWFRQIANRAVDSWGLKYYIYYPGTFIHFIVLHVPVLVRAHVLVGLHPFSFPFPFFFKKKTTTWKYT